MKELLSGGCDCGEVLVVIDKQLDALDNCKLSEIVGMSCRLAGEQDLTTSY
jgi:hypothetical protein